MLAWIQPWIESLPIRLFGLNLFAIRIESLIFGIALLGVIYAIVKRLYSARAALLTTAIGAFSIPFTFSSHLARPDIAVALCGFGAVALYLYDSPSGFTLKSVFSGLLIGLAIDIHLNVAIFGPVIVVLFFVDYGLKTLRLWRFWGFIAGVSVGLGFYIAIHILPYPQSYFAINNIESSLSHTPPILMADTNMWLWAVSSTFWLMGALLWPLIIASAFILLRRRTQADKRLLTISTTLIVTFTALILNKPNHYAILIAPAAWMLIGSLIDYLAQQPWQRTIFTYIRTVGVLSLISASVIFALAPMLNDPTQDWQTMLNYVSETIPAKSTTIGQQNWWFARPSDPYMSWEQLVYYRRYAPGSTLEDAFRNLKPQYLVADNTTRFYELDTLSKLDADYSSSFVLKSEMEAFMQHHCHLVSSISTRTFGDVSIYKIEW